MIYHATITHPPGHCPGGSREKLPDLASSMGARAPRLLLWDAGCFTGGDAATHTAYAVVDAASVEAAEELLRGTVPDHWRVTAAPVLLLPHQLDLVERLGAGEPGKVEQAASALAESAGAQPASQAMAMAPSIQNGPETPAASPTESSTATQVLPAAAGQHHRAAAPPATPSTAAPAPGPTAAPTEPPTGAAGAPDPDAGAIHDEPAAPESTGAGQPVTDTPAPPQASGAPDGATERPARPTAAPSATTMAVSQEDIARTRAEITKMAAAQEAEKAIAAGPASSPPRAPAPGPAPLGVSLVTADGLRSWTIPPDGAYIGQGRENAIQIADDQVAAQHARVILWQGTYWVQDLGASPAGVTVNGTRIQQSAPLKAGDVIGLGRANLVFRL